MSIEESCFGAEHDQVKPSFPLSEKGKKHAKEAFKISIKARRGIRKKNMDYVENLLSSKRTKKTKGGGLVHGKSSSIEKLNKFNKLNKQLCT